MILDQLIALRVLYLLVTPFKKQEAYKLGVIDENGNPKLAIKDMNPAQKASYTMLHRLCFRLKKVLAKLPFGKTTLASMAAAYVLVRENLESQSEPDNLEQLFEEKLNSSSLVESVIVESDVDNLFVLLEKVLAEFSVLIEDGGAVAVPTNTTSGISATVNKTPVIDPKIKRSITLSRDKFKLVKAIKESDRKQKIFELMSIENIDFIINEEDCECLAL